MEYSRGAFVCTGWLIVAGLWFSNYWATAATSSHRRVRSSPTLAVSAVSDMRDMDNLSKTIGLVDECAARMRALFNANLRLRKENLALVGQLRFLAQCRGTYLSAYWSSIRGSVERNQMRIDVHGHTDRTEETLDIFRKTAARLHYLALSARFLAAQNDELSRRLQLLQEQRHRNAQTLFRPERGGHATVDLGGDGNNNGDNTGWCWYLSRFIVLVVSGLGLHLVWVTV